MTSPPDGSIPGLGGGNAHPPPQAASAMIVEITNRVARRVTERLDVKTANLPRRLLAVQISAVVGEVLVEGDYKLELSAQRDLVAAVLDSLTEQAGDRPAPAPSIAAHITAVPATGYDRGSMRNRIDDARSTVQPMLLERLDIAAASQLPRRELVSQITEVVGEIVVEQRLKLNLLEQRELVSILIDDMLGLGPLEPLLADETVTDIMVNGAETGLCRAPRQAGADRRRSSATTRTS